MYYENYLITSSSILLAHYNEKGMRLIKMMSVNINILGSLSSDFNEVDNKGLFLIYYNFISKEIITAVKNYANV